MIALIVNGTQHDVDVEDAMPLLWVLRDVLGLTGTKFGCGMAQCGACTVHVDGAAMFSCVTPVSAVRGKPIVTIEGLAAAGTDPVVRAWTATRVPQCGYCQPGQIMAASALLKSNPHPSDDEIAQGMHNICRCGTYQRINAAVRAASNEGT